VSVSKSAKYSLNTFLVIILDYIYVKVVGHYDVYIVWLPDYGLNYFQWDLQYIKILRPCPRCTWTLPWVSKIA